MKFLIFLGIVYFVLVSFQKEISMFPQDFSQGFSQEKNLLNCEYATLWCESHSAKNFRIECFPTFSHVLYNQTTCPSLKNHFLTGFSS